MGSHGHGLKPESMDDDQFHDARLEEFSDSSGNFASTSCHQHAISDSPYLRYQFWTCNFESVHLRRLNFLRWLNFDSFENSMLTEELSDPFSNDTELRVHEIIANSGTVLRTSSVAEGLPSSQFTSDSSPNEASVSLENGTVAKNLAFTIKNLDDGTQYIADDLDDDGRLCRLRLAGSDQLITMDEFQRSSRPSPLVVKLLQRDSENTRLKGISERKVKKGWKGWLRKLSSAACVIDSHGSAELNHKYLNSINEIGIKRVQVHSHRKQFRELSSLCNKQEFQAHKGAILTMKLSLDGRYIASGGEDGIVRVWKVVVDEKPSELAIVDYDPTCIYFKMNKISCLAPLGVNKEKPGMVEKLKISSDSTCVIIPPKEFHILDRPLHEFQGHGAEILDLSWSQRGFLLSSSVDKTVRLWQVGIDRCLRVFSHNNYVTSVNFCPDNDDFFISGSIDGKVRIWEVIHCQVTDYIDIREIVTAVCYRPDGKGAVVGTMAGKCLFYNVIDNHLQLDSQLCLQSKRKTPAKRITGFLVVHFCPGLLWFSPSDPSKLLVSSADSLICIISGVNVLCKLKGLKNAGSQMPASFTSDGKHIISVTEDSNVYIWNYSTQDKTSSQPKNIWSSESFLSHNASIAIPWCGIELMSGAFVPPELRVDMNQRDSTSSPDHFSSSRGFVLESVPKVSATWPEEALLDSNPMVVSPRIGKSEYKFLKSACKGISTSHLWGQVIVTAGWDGQIRAYHNYGLPVHV